LANGLEMNSSVNTRFWDGNLSTVVKRLPTDTSDFSSAQKVGLENEVFE
jgi:hypothetical protein